MNHFDKIEWIGVLNSDEPFSEGSLETTAQRRNLLQWLHEKVNVPRHAAEMYSDTYKEQMRSLREIDDSVRDTAKDLDGFLSSAKRAIKNRNYLDAIHFIGNINDTIKTIVRSSKPLQDSLTSDLEDFYGDHEHADLGREYFEKEAGILDLFRGKSRRGAGELFEKMYRNVLKERVRAMNDLINSADYLVGFAFETLKELGTARARGDVGSYLEHLEKLGRKRSDFEKKFKGTYEKHIVPMLEKIKSKHVPAAVEKNDEPASASNEPFALVNETAPESEYAELPDLSMEGPGDLQPTQVVPEAVSKNESALEPEEFEPASGVTESVQVPESKPDEVEYKIPEKFLQQPKLSPAVEIDNETGKARRVSATPLIEQLMKSGMDNKLIFKALIDYSADFDNAGQEQAALECIAFAEAFVDDDFTEAKARG